MSADGLCLNVSPPSFSTPWSWAYEENENDLAATAQVRVTFISRLPALTSSNVILSAKARGMTTVLLSAF